MPSGKQPVVRLFHWREAEAKPLIADIEKAGYRVDYPGDKANGNWRSIRERPPHAVVIDLTRLPAHGRYVANGLRVQKATRMLPIVFLDGEPEKVAKIRGELPDAQYTSRAKLAAALKRAKPVTNPVVPPSTIASYSNRTTAQKMGIREGNRVAVIDAPSGYAKILGDMPEGASLEEEPPEILPITIWFVHDPDTFLGHLPRMRALTEAKSRLWVIWPKASSALGQRSGFKERGVRGPAIEFGLVDYKICSVNETWSGILFARKKST